MNLKELEQTINAAIQGITEETAHLNKGTTIIRQAQEASDQAIHTAQEVIDTFAQSEEALRGLETRLQEVNFPEYFTGLQDTLIQTEQHMSDFSDMMTKLAQQAADAKDKMEVFQQQSGTDLSQLTAEVQGFSKLLESLNLSQRLKDLEYAQVKAASQQESARKEIKALADQGTAMTVQVQQLQRELDRVKDSLNMEMEQKFQAMAAQQAQILEQLAAQQAQAEEAQNKMNGRITMTVTVAGIVLIAAGVIIKFV